MPTRIATRSVTAAFAGAALIALAGCGGSSDDEPALIRAKTLTVAMPVSQGAVPPEFNQELMKDLAERLELEMAAVPAAGVAPATGALVHHRADAGAPMPIRTRTAATLDYSAPYYADPNTGTLYGIAVIADPDPEKAAPLLEDLDEALSEIKDDGTLQKLYDEWLPGTDVPDPVLNDETP